MAALSQPELSRRNLVATQKLVSQGKPTGLANQKMGKSRGSSPYSRAQAAKKAPAKKFNQAAYTKTMNKVFGLKK